MAFFKLHKGNPKSRAAARPAPPALGSVETLRRRARHRLMGATILVALGVAGLPRLFDSDPRPLPVNVPITITNPQRLSNPAPAASALPPAVPSHAVIVESAEGTREIAPRSAARPTAVPTPTATALSGDSPPARPVLNLPSPPKNKDKEKTKSKPKSEPEPAAANRPAKPFIVHLGAFTDSAKVRAVRTKVEAAGLPTYVQIVERKQEKRTLVRIGPLKSRSEADAAASRVRKLDLSASVLERER